jgi:hypothetical protein
VISRADSGESDLKSTGATRQPITASQQSAAAEMKAAVLANGAACTGAVTEAAEAVAPDVDETLMAFKDIACGNTFFRADTVPANGQLTYATSGATSTRDPVLVMIMRTNPWNSTSGPTTPPYTDQVQIRTLAQNDNRAPGNYNSFITFTNPEGYDYNVWVMGFLAPNKTDYGTLSVTRTRTGSGSTTTTESFTSGSWKMACGPDVFTSNSTIDPVLFGFDTVNMSTNGAWNDDCVDGPPGNRESCFHHFSGATMYFTCNSFYGSAGTTRISC